jgi:paired amphipathic helix protein Sin3a
MYLKSLDHMGIHVKTADKKIFATKNIVDLIKLKHEEQRRQRSLKGRVSRYQFAYDFKDSGVIVDAIRLAVLYVTNAGQHSGQERERIAQFFERFIPLFFDISLDSVQDRVRDISRGSPEDDMEDVAPAELTNGRGRRANGKKADLLRGVLDRSRNGIKSRSQKEDSAASGSKESTPDDLSTLDDDGDVPEAPEDQAVTEVTNERWLTTIPGPGALAGTKPLEPADVELKADKLFQRDYYNLYCNQTIIVFFTLFEILYRRLKSIKDSEQDVIEEVRRARRPKPAKDIGLIDDKNEFFNDDFSGDYYSKALFVMEEFITGDMDEARYQDFFRRYYLKKGWALYTVHELLKSLCRMAAACSGSDSKDKTPDILELFAENRDKEETTYNTEINLRKQVEKYVKDGEMFLIKYVSTHLRIIQHLLMQPQHPRVHQATVQLILKDETTFELTDMERKERWKYYTSSFVRIEPTEGVPRDRVRKSVLTRNLPSGFDTDSDISGTALQQRKPILFSEDLVLQICVNTYTLMYKKGTSEWFIYNNSQDSEKAAQMTENRNQKFREKFHMNSKWMKNLSQAQVQEANQSFEKWVKDGVIPSAASAAAASTGSATAAAGVPAALSEETVQGEE